MNEHKKAELFNHDLDKIMEGNPPSSTEDLDSQQLFELASVLKETDYSGEKNTQERLRRQFIKTCLENHITRNNKEGIMKKLWGQHRTAAALSSLAIIFMLAVTLIFPGTVTAVADNISANISKIINLGKYSTVIQVDDPAPRESMELTEEQKEQLREEGSLTVNTPDGDVIISSKDYAKKDENTVKYASIKEAQEMASFNILVPAYLPTGYEFKEAESYSGSGDYINLYYKGSGKDIGLMERAMNEHTQFVASTNGEVQEVEINGATGALERNSLTWEKDGVSCMLFYHGFSQEEALKIARSIK